MKPIDLARAFACTILALGATPSEARFLQVDPVGYKDQVNLYEYVGDDPVNRSDATGTYMCTGSKADCAEAETRVNNVRVAARDQNLSKQDRQLLSRVANFYGKANTRNGVDVVTVKPQLIRGLTQDPNAGATMIQSHSSPNNIAILIPKGFAKFMDDFSKSPSAIGKDLSRWSAGAERANVMAHEGEHGIDARETGRTPEGPAYEAGRAVERSMGAIPARDLPDQDDQ